MKMTELDQTLNDLVHDFLVNERGLKIENIQPLTSRGLVIKRMVPFIPILTRLSSDYRLAENPKPLQLVSALMSYRVEQEIMGAYKSIDYNQEHGISIDMIAIYFPKMMDFIKNKLIKLYSYSDRNNDK